jgi:hypothetical protein
MPSLTIPAGIDQIGQGRAAVDVRGLSGHETDADIAALQWDYYDLAVASPRVIGLLDFGFWTSPAWENGGAGAASLPQTVDSNERVTARILAAAG